MAEAHKYAKRLIEFDLPIRAISDNARREKATSTITGLHLWWARRPLAACRAVVCASLWFDPTDVDCPSDFRSAAAAAIRGFAAKASSDREIAEICGATWQRWLALHEKSLETDARELRDALLLFVELFSSTRAALYPACIQLARELTAASAVEGAQRPVILDPFAGGGSIPIEAIRAGASVIAGDVNPVALLINDVQITRAAQLGPRLREAVLRTAQEISERLAHKLGQFYPVRDGRIPVAYLWARTVLSEAPGTDELPVEVPMLRSMCLSKRPGNLTALRWVRGPDQKIVCDALEIRSADGARRRVLRPRLELFHPSTLASVEPGTAAGGGATCPVTGFTTPKARVRAQLMPRRGGSRDARLVAVVTRPRTGPGRTFHTPTALDEAALAFARTEFSRVKWPIDELLPGGRVWKNNPFRIHNYGMSSWGDLFNERQHAVLSLLAAEISSLNGEDERILDESVQAVLALSVARLADHMNTGCRWQTGGEKAEKLFARQAVPMVWDFCEISPVGGSVGDWLNMVKGACDALAFVPDARGSVDVIQASAASCPLPDDVVDAIITDPPYYDAVPYADLSEFFYVWLRRCSPKARREWFDAAAIDRDPEIVFDGNRGKDAAFYVGSMTRALTEARRVTKPDGIGVVVFAHKSTSGWEALLQAMLDAGWVVTASWPIDTELSTRVRAMGSAALASSVHLVCRPREDRDGALGVDSVGDWRFVLEELPRRIHSWLPRLAKEGVVGADAIFACLGPALEVFSRYACVEKVSGDRVELREYLEHVWAAVSREALAMIFDGAETAGLESDARLTAMWLWTLASEAPAGTSAGNRQSDLSSASGEDDEDAGPTAPSIASGFVLEFDAARKIAQGLGARLEELEHVVEVDGETARLLPAAERAKHLFGPSQGVPTAKKTSKKKQQMNLLPELDQAEDTQSWGDVGAPKAGTTTLDRVHQSMLLFGAGRGEALKRFLVEEGVGKQFHFWKLAQSLSALYPVGSDEKRWVDGVLARKKGLGFG